MLTLRDPIQLHIAAPATAVSEQMEARISGNYSLISMDIKPEDLLHLVTEPVSLFVQEGGITNLAVDNRISNRQDLKVELLNNVLNRILLSDAARITYQDRIYLTQALHRLGVQDVQTFFSRVREMQREQLQIKELLEHYGEILQDLEEQPGGTPAVRARTQERPEGSEKDAKAPVWFLHEEIYRRLDSRKIYYEVERQRSTLQSDSREITAQQLQLAQTTQTADALLLTELRSFFSGRTQFAVPDHRNPYELQTEIREQVTAQTVREQLSAAVLYHICDMAFYSHMEQLQKNTNLWLDSSAAFYQSGENTFKRFEYYHTEGRLLQGNMLSRQDTINKLYAQELQLLENYSQYLQYTQEETQYLAGNTVLAGENAMQLILAQTERLSEENTEAVESREISREESKEVNALRELHETETLLAERLQSAERTVLSQEEHKSIHILRELLMRTEHAQVRETFLQRLDRVVEMQQSLRVLEQRSALRTLLLYRENLPGEAGHLIREERMLSAPAYSAAASGPAAQSAPAHSAAPGSNADGEAALPGSEGTEPLSLLSVLRQYLKVESRLSPLEREEYGREFIRQTAERFSITEHEVERIWRENAEEVYADTEETRSGGDEEHSRAFKRYLDQVNEQNIKNQEKLRQALKYLPSRQQSALRSDLKKTRQKALEALESPGEVLREIYEAEPASVPEQRDPKVEALLGGLDENTRVIYEQILRREYGTELAEGCAPVREATVTELLTQLQREVGQEKSAEEGVLQENRTVERLLAHTQTILKEHGEKSHGGEQHLPLLLPEAAGGGGEGANEDAQPRQWERETVLSELERIRREMERTLPLQPVEELVRRELMEYSAAERTEAEFREIEEKSRTIYLSAAQAYKNNERGLALTETVIGQLHESRLVLQDARREETQIQLLQRTEMMEAFSEQISEVVTNILYRSAAASPPEQVKRMVRQKVPIVLKQMEQELPEELTQWLEKRQERRIESTQTAETVAQEQVQVQNTQMNLQRMAETTAQEIQSMIEQGILSQMGMISDRVYTKLEKRLQSERARRGR